VAKTYKMHVNGAFIRSESGRSMPVEDTEGRVVAHACLASRKDLRNAVVAARKASAGWAGRSAFNRGQILYRMAEMLEGRRAEMIDTLAATGRTTREEGTREVDASIDRLVHFAGWTDKFAQTLGCQNPVAGPYYNFTVPAPTGVVGVVAPDEAALAALVALLAPPLCAGCVVIGVGSESNPLPASLFGEICATSDVPAGVINLLTGRRADIVEHLASHRGIDALHACALPEAQAHALRAGSAENLKRVCVRRTPPEAFVDADVGLDPMWIEPFVDMKTIWHPALS